MKAQIETKFNIMDKVYHVTPESLPGCVLDINYSLLTKDCKYLVAFSQAESNWYYEHELTLKMNFK
jgi:hypothetical protein